MPASFDGNDGNDGNAANSGGGGNATSSSAGWFFADRVNLPLVTTPDTGPNAPNPPVSIGKLPIINVPKFPDRNWSAEWNSWLASERLCADGLDRDPTPHRGWLAELGAVSRPGRLDSP